MATDLEAAGVDRRQAEATLEAIANSIERFAVTPERLEKIIEASQQALYERIKREMDQRFDSVDQRFDSVDQRFEGNDRRFDGYDQKFQSIKQQFAAVNERFNDLNRRMDDMRAEQRADSSRLFNLMLAIALGMAGVAGSLLLGKLF